MSLIVGFYLTSFVVIVVANLENMFHIYLRKNMYLYLSVTQLLENAIPS